MQARMCGQIQYEAHGTETMLFNITPFVQLVWLVFGNRMLLIIHYWKKKLPV